MGVTGHHLRTSLGGAIGGPESLGRHAEQSGNAVPNFRENVMAVHYARDSRAMRHAEAARDLGVGQPAPQQHEADAIPARPATRVSAI